MSVLVLVKASIMSTMNLLRDLCRSEEQSSWKGVERRWSGAASPGRSGERDCILCKSLISRVPARGRTALHIPYKARGVGVYLYVIP